jgi:transcriptional regulator with XRE-family HTH domain
MPKSTFSDAYASAIELLIASRKDRGISQVELARRLGRPQQFVSLFERRQRRLDIVEYWVILRAIGADPEAAVRDLAQRLPASLTI